MNTKPDTRAAAKASIDALLTTLKEQLAQPGQSLLPLLGAMSRFSKYSLANQMLIFGQRPDATHVLGYRAWNDAGYQVRKGEKGIAIYAAVRLHPRRTGQTNLARSSRTAAPASAWPMSSTSVRSTARRHRAGIHARPFRHRHHRRAPRARSPQGLPRRPQRRTRIPGAATRPARLHRRSPHHLTFRPGTARRVRHPRARVHPRAAALPGRLHAPAPT